MQTKLRKKEREGVFDFFTLFTAKGFGSFGLLLTISSNLFIFWFFRFKILKKARSDFFTQIFLRG